MEAAGAAVLNALGGALAGLLETVADDPLGGPAGENFHLGRHFIRRALAQAATLADILALAVFADHQHVDVPGPVIFQVLAGAGQ